MRALGDAVISAFFAEDKPKAREKRRATIESWVAGSAGQVGRVARGGGGLRTGEHPLSPFHWAVEFPEVFARQDPGFDAIVGNPPFLAGGQLEPALGKIWRSFIVMFIADGETGTRGAGDLSAYFVLRSYHLLRKQGCCGLVTTNSISQGDTRTIGLGKLVRAGATIYNAVRSLDWPGEANLQIAKLWISKCRIQRAFNLNGKQVLFINSYLYDAPEVNEVARLLENQNIAFEGVKHMGDGFIISESEANDLISKQASAYQVVRPFLSGQDINSRPDSSPSRWTINFKDFPLDRGSSNFAYSGAVAEDFPGCLQLIERRVRPQRMLLSPRSSGNCSMKERWWQYFLWRPALYRAISGIARVLVKSGVSSHHLFTFTDSHNVIANSVVAFALESV